MPRSDRAGVESAGQVVFLVAFAMVLIAVQAPRLGGGFAAWAAPVFTPARGFLDFDVAYYPAAQAVLHDPQRLYGGVEFDRGRGTLRRDAPANFVNIPLVAWLFVPFALLPLQPAGLLLLGINSACSVGCLFLMLRRTSTAAPVWRGLLALTFISSGPLMYALNLGQTTPWVLLLLLFLDDDLRHRNDGRAGVWLGLMCLIKIPPLLLLPYLAFRHRWRIVIVAAGLVLAAVIASLWLYGPDVFERYVDVAIRANAGKAVAAHNCQSVDALLARLFTDASQTSWQPVELSGRLRVTKWLILAALVGIVGRASASTRSSLTHDRMRLEMGAVLCLALLALPIYWVHYGAWLLPAFAAVGAVCVSERLWCRGAFLGVAVLLVNFPVPPPSVVRQFGDQMWFRVLISHQFVGTLLLLWLTAWGAKTEGKVESGRVS